MDLKYGIWAKAAIRKWKATESFIVGRAEDVRRWLLEPHARHSYAFGFRRYHCLIATIPLRIRL